MPDLPPLPEPNLPWWPAMTDDYQQALRAWARTYAEQYGRLCAEAATQAEREACAKLAQETYEGGCHGDGDSGYDFYGERSADAIRARSTR